MTIGKPFDPIHAARHGYTREDWDAVDLPELTDQELAEMRPMSEVLPELHAALTRSISQKEAEAPATVRLDTDLAQKLRATGPGWERRVNEVLRRWVDEAA